VLRLRWRRGARILCSDVHKFVGITSVPINLILGFTGAYWNLTQVAREWLHPFPPTPVMTHRLYAETLSLDALVADASHRLPGFRTGFISLPSSAAFPTVTLWGGVEPAGALRSEFGSTIVYDAHTSAWDVTHDKRVAGVWEQVVDAFRPLHFGEFGSWPVKVAWCLAGLAPGVLALSGVTIWWTRRPKAHRRSRRDGRAGPLGPPRSSDQMPQGVA
jgi:uncharacterized iron-regulated membrane protein